jgi:hypothetical protein
MNADPKSSEEIFACLTSEVLYFLGDFYIFIFFILHLGSGVAESPTVGLDGAGILLHQFKETKGSLLILLGLGLHTV